MLLAAIGGLYLLVGLAYFVTGSLLSGLYSGLAYLMSGGSIWFAVSESDTAILWRIHPVMGSLTRLRDWFRGTLTLLLGCALLTTAWGCWFKPLVGLSGVLAFSTLECWLAALFYWKRSKTDALTRYVVHTIIPALALWSYFA